MRPTTRPARLLGALTLLAPATLDGAAAQELAKIVASDGAEDDAFGWSVALSGDHLAVGALEDDDGGFNAGAVYVFERSGCGPFGEVRKLVPAGLGPVDRFGYSVSVSGDALIAGAFLDDDNGGGAGAAYVFQRQANGTWATVAKLLASDGTAGDNFGLSVSISGDRAVVGAWGDGNGSAYVFERQGPAHWGEVQKLVAGDGEPGDDFGIGVAISGDHVVVGARDDDDLGLNAGAAYVFERQPNGVWTEAAKLLASDGAETDLFGEVVAVSGDVAVVGAWANDVVGDGSGAAYVFERQPDGSWPELQRLLASDPESHADFGLSVSAFGRSVAAGAWKDDHPNGVDAGAAYVSTPSPTVYGTGCPGTAGVVPALAAAGCPRLGNVVSVKLSGGLGGAFAALLVGFAESSAPLGGDCSLLVDPAPAALPFFLGGAGPGGGAVALSGHVPWDSPLVDLRLQAFVADPEAATGLSGTNGVRFTIEP